MYRFLFDQWTAESGYGNSVDAPLPHEKYKGTTGGEAACCRLMTIYFSLAL
jgi:hypothetical protein